MVRERIDSYRIREQTYCVCGKKIGARGHDRDQCLVWLKHDPAPGGGQPAPWQIPTKLFSESEPAHISKSLEKYLDFWGGRYRRALESLEDRSPDQYRTFIAVYHEGYTPRELASGWGVPLETVRTWRKRAVVHMQRRAGDSRDWEKNPAGNLERVKMTDSEWAAERARLIEANKKKDVAA